MGLVTQLKPTVYIRKMQKIAFITTCSARKNNGESTPVSVKELPAGTQASLLKHWKKLLEGSDHRKPVWDIYSGRAILEMKKLSQKHNASLSIISAGLGLVDSSEKKPLYDLTVSGSNSSSIVSKINSGPFSLRDWWSGVNGNNSSPISNFIQSNEGTSVVIVLSSRYFDLVRHDLESMPREVLRRIRIVGIKPHPDSVLNPAILPYDDRLNGPDSPIPGTLSDYPQRCAVHFMQNIYNGGTLSEDSERVVQCMESLAWPVRTTGRKMDDGQIVRVIKEAIHETGLPKTKLLRHLRHNLKIACEQKRFGGLYEQATKGIADGKKN